MHNLQPAAFLANLKAGRTQTIVTYGTSLTAGGQWVQDLRAWLEQDYPGLATVINRGMGGKASNTALAELDEQVLAQRPDTVFLEFAVNDASNYQEGNMDHGISPEKSRANLNMLVDRIKQFNPGTEIILQTMNPAWDAPNGNRSASRRPLLAQYYEGWREVAKDRGLRLIDHYPLWLHLQNTDIETFVSYIPDGVHPAPEGSTAMTFSNLKAALTYSQIESKQSIITIQFSALMHPG